MGSIDDDMMNALLGSERVPTLDEMKRYISRRIDTATLKDRYALCEIIKRKNELHLVIQDTEGVLVNIDSLSTDTITAIYNLLIFKLGE